MTEGKEEDKKVMREVQTNSPRSLEDTNFCHREKIIIATEDSESTEKLKIF